MARGDFNEKSDIDVFLETGRADVERIERSCKRSLRKFCGSKEFEKFRLRGIKNEIKPIVGVLEEWKSLEESVKKDSVVLFSVSTLRRGEKNFLVVIEPIKDVKKRNKVIRYLFGRKEKIFKKKGMVEALGGKILTPRSFLIKSKDFKEVGEFLARERVKFSILEVWT